MHYEDEGLGFSFTLPDGWKKMEFAIPLTFIANIGTIQINAGDAQENFIDSARREQHLKEPGCRIIPNKTLGGEPNTVMIENERNEGIISTVRDNLMYNITYINANNPAMRKAIENLMVSFRFPSLDKWVQAIQEASKAHPGDNASDPVHQSTPLAIGGKITVPTNPQVIPEKQESQGFLSRFFGRKKELSVLTCETCSHQMLILESPETGAVTLSVEDFKSGIGCAEQCWECGRVYCSECYPSRPPNTCVCGRGRDAVRRFKNRIQRGSLRLIKVRYIN